jgi:hypothetical protein
MFVVVPKEVALRDLRPEAPSEVTVSVKKGHHRDATNEKALLVDDAQVFIRDETLRALIGRH